MKQSTADEFVASTHHQNIKALPERVEHKAEGGRVGYPKPFRW